MWPALQLRRSGANPSSAIDLLGKLGATISSHLSLNMSSLGKDTPQGMLRGCRVWPNGALSSSKAFKCS